MEVGGPEQSIKLEGMRDQLALRAYAYLAALLEEEETSFQKQPEMKEN